uniref:putative F-box protein At1g30920 n=1 Tax=Fragaria vesca subsp. vesca TaxID=101020 RepID=UPI0005C8BCC0|nr:PREDICTED: putative F-box protein At1g30920 [Fragaria vesca subsp. vesca]
MAGVGRDFLTVCVDVSKYIMPHLLLVFSIEWLEKKQREANPPGTFKLFNMPDDIIMDILMRLPLRSLCCLRCVSKACLDMVDSPSFTTLHRERLLKMSSNDYVAAASSEVPQLIQLQYNYPSIKWQPLEIDDECRLTQTKYPLHVSKMFNALDFVFCNLFFFQRNLREYMESINPNSYYLIDPLRREGLRIPHCPTNHKDLVHQFGMGFDNTTNTYKIVCVSGSLENHHATTHIYVLGTESSSWREIWSVAPRPLSGKNVCAYGDMHWLVEEAGSHVNVAGGSHIISFDFKKEEFCWTPHPTLKRLRPGFGNSRLLEDLHLLNMKGSMAMVDTNSSKEYIDIWVVKSYLKK